MELGPPPARGEMHRAEILWSLAVFSCAEFQAHVLPRESSLHLTEIVQGETQSFL